MVHAAHEDRLHDVDRQLLDDPVWEIRDYFYVSFLLTGFVENVDLSRYRRDIEFVFEQEKNFLRISIHVRKHFFYIPALPLSFASCDDDCFDQFQIEHLLVEVAGSFRY